jgi:hypothetical protein
MSKFECNTCEGRGRIEFGPPKNFMWSVVYAHKTCPTCRGSGYMALGVETPVPFGRTGASFTVPLTDAEIEKLARLPKLDLLAGRIDVMYDPQNLLVTLIPWEKEE